MWVQSDIVDTCHNFVKTTSNLICNKEVAIRTNVRHMINIAGII